MRWLTGLLALLLIGGLLLTLVGSHGCDAEGTSPNQIGASQQVED